MSIQLARLYNAKSHQSITPRSRFVLRFWAICWSSRRVKTQRGTWTPESTKLNRKAPHVSYLKTYFGQVLKTVSIEYCPESMLCADAYSAAGAAGLWGAVIVGSTTAWAGSLRHGGGWGWGWNWRLSMIGLCKSRIAVKYDVKLTI